ncbi:MAG: amino acid adenylation domain-containing protein [Burkholderiales bacterium]|nr:amino acid adenylation domain-containing protein [Burkholderiales bacterium]
MSTTENSLSERIARLSDEKRALLEARLAEAKKEKNAGIPKCEPMDAYPLSFAQERLWFLSQLEPDDPFYNEAGAVEFDGAVNQDALNWSINQIVRRHEVLRTAIAVTPEGQPRQVVLQDAKVTIGTIDLQSRSERQRERDAQRLMEQETRKPFDLAAAPPFKVVLIQTGVDKYILLLVLHHIVADQWSIRLLIQELGVFYRAYFSDQKPLLPELPIQYADYANWQREKLQGTVYDKQMDFWMGQLTGAAPVLELPVDLPRPAVLKHRGKKYHFELAQEVTASLKQFCQSNNATLFTTLAAVFAVLLNRYTGQKDICIGYPVANRSRAELQNLIGFFVNTLVLRTDFTDNPHFRTLLARTKTATQEAQAHQDLPFEAVVDALKPVRDTAYNPLFQVMFVFQSETDGKFELPGIKSRFFELDSGGTKFDVTLCVYEEKGRFKAWLEYNTDLFFEQTIARWSEHYGQLLKAVMAQPDMPIAALNYLFYQERRQLLYDWNATAANYPQGRCIHELFEAQAARNPGALAVVFEDQQLTYAQLNAKANQLACTLRGRGVGPEVSVGICVERSLEMVIGILGILKAGGAYVPIDPKAPQARLMCVLENTEPALVLTQERLQALLPPNVARFCLDSEWDKVVAEKTDNVASGVTPQNLAYVLYTSGSTGKPKGVAVSHRNVVNATQARLDYYQQPVDGFLWLSAMTFDSSIAGLFGTLSQGGRLVLPQDGAILDVKHLLQLITDHAVTHLLTVPSLYKALLGQIAPHQTNSLKAAIVAGEACHPDLVDLHGQVLPQVALFNEYGPTEATVWCSVHSIQPRATQRTIPIGRPIANTQIYLLDDDLNPVPVGVTGELYIGGMGITRGYLNNPELTANRFVPDPYGRQPGARLYRTGDLARYRADGNIEYIGRGDHQVKIRGFRIELGEVEAALLQLEPVKEAVALVREDNLANPQLVAYLVGNTQAPDIEAIRAQLKTRLPDYMIPAAFVHLDVLPLTEHGKVDRNALPAPDLNDQLTHEYVAPRNPTEAKLVQIWTDVLGVEKIGVHDNFFELGGDSILSIQIISRARQFGIAITSKTFFQHQTVGALAENIAGEQYVEQETVEQGAVTGSVPFIPIQRWFFEQNLPNFHHWNQSVLLKVRDTIDVSLINAVVEKLEQHHDVLRSRFLKKKGQWQQVCSAETGTGVFQQVELTEQTDDEYRQAIEMAATQWQQSLHLEKGPLWRVVWLDPGRDRPCYLLIVIHHLVVDGVSWRILLEDLQTCYQQALDKQSFDLPPKSTAFQYWAKSLSDDVAGGMLDDQIDYWRYQINEPVALLPVDKPAGTNTEALAGRVTEKLSRNQTDMLLRETNSAYHTQINDLLLSALLQVLCDWSQSDSVRINLEGHGRESALLHPDIDLSRTVGWFTSSFPTVLILPNPATPGDIIKSVKEQLRAIPDKGLGYGLLRYSGKIEPIEQIATCSPPQVNFNYLGQFDQTLAKDSPFVLAEESVGTEHDGAGLRGHELEVSACVVDNQLQVSWAYGKARYHKKTIDFLAQAYMSVLQGLVQHCAMLEQEEFTPSDFPLARLDQSGLDLISRNKPDLEDIYPVAPLQQGLIFHSLYAPEAGMYCNQFSCMLTGELNTDMFLQAWRHLVAGHPILRTAFLLDEVVQPLQLVYKNVEMPVDHVDWRNLSEEEQAQRWHEYLLDDRRKPFVFDRAPLMRFALIRCAAHRYYFLWSHHHALLDGWCTPLIFQEVFDVYEALSRKQKIASATGRPYRDYIAWLQMQDQSSAEKYWRTVLQDFSACTSFGSGVTSYAAENTDNHGDRATYTVTLESESASQLVDFARHHQLTLNTLVQGVWALLLSRYSNEQDVVFGITVSGRPAELVDVDRMIGLFINTVPLRVGVRPEMRVVDWLRALFEQNQALRRFEYTPLTDIQKWSDIPNGQSLFESLLVFENFPVDWAVESDAEKIGIREIVFSEQTNYPMTITAAHVPAQGLVLRFEYWNDLFPECTVVRMANHFQRLLESVVCTPDARLADLSILAATERDQLLVDWNATDAAYTSDCCIHQLFELRAEQDSQAIAVDFAGRQVTYGQLNAKANQLAHYLRTRGVGPEVVVGLCVERSLEMVIGLLGILKAGGAYMPIDPRYPQERIAFMLDDARPALNLVHAATRAILSDTKQIVDLDAQWKKIAQYREDNPSHTARTQNLAYVIYTSGSTGKPKGAALMHDGIVNRLEWMQRQYRLDAQDRVLQKTPFSFDVSVWEFFWPLLAGARLVIAPPGAHRDGRHIARIVQDEAITVMHFVPSMLSAFLDVLDVSACKSLRHVICSGEALSANLQNKFYEKLPAQLHNLYGPTEASIDVTVWACERESEDAVVPIGRPIANTRIYLLDSFLHPVPVGVPGELYIGGVGLARGYQNRSALTAGRFIPDPFSEQPGARLYRTGDLARYRADGEIEYIGRTDHQVKIRGFRIELGEIEAVLLQHEQVKEAVAIVREDTADDKRLVAYLVGNESTPDIETIRKHLQTGLPDYMIPTAFVCLDRLPLSANGKLDHRALPAPDANDRLTHEYVAPRNPTEQILAGIWGEVLGVEKVGVHDNFFELGGHSLLVMQVMLRIDTRLRIKLPLRTFFEKNTVATLAAAIGAAQWLGNCSAASWMESGVDYDEVDL